MNDSGTQKKVSIGKCDDYERENVFDSVKKAVDLIGGIGSFVSPGQKVFLKFNMLLGKDPEKSVTTHPEVVYAVAKLLKDYGCIVMMGDSPGSGLSYTEKVLRKNYALAGYDKISEELDIPLNYDTGFREMPAPNGRITKRFPVINPVFDADAVIVVSKAKTHALTYLSGAAKNMFGVIPGFEKPLYHGKMPLRDDFCSMIVDLNDAVKPKLQVMDAIMAMEGDGPHSGTPRKIGVVMASEDYSAIDFVTAGLMSYDPLKIGTISEAVNRGYIKSDFSDIEVTGENPGDFAVKDFRHPSTYSGKGGAVPDAGLRRKVMQVLFKILAREAPLPVIDKKTCIRCMRCVRSCPKGAITVIDAKPVIDYKDCIKCYCCHEMCDESAISLKRNIFGRIIAKIAGLS
ncbi:uncharacterized protein (DUF362 family)/ferredoxin [Methanomicrobium sp. W14]|uniref:DUF362 domain-containing protein n=1 Tax=Methanomicrobium sp. W14 TaxID=2817839 RepID=UPI001AE5ADCA|nr:DUF362 domain-containing protein [Methanomicrobium sp. W14]MBP2133495.1 uncharacterized protein (DUF362 family)/ferredoxin [Methanomicrobium sp. W14]